MQPYPRSPDLLWPDHLQCTGCLSVRAMDNGFPTVARRACFGLSFAVTPPFLAWVYGVLVLVRVWNSPRQSWQGCWGVCVLVCGLPLCPANPGCGSWCVCVGSGF